MFVRLAFYADKERLTYNVNKNFKAGNYQHTFF